MTHWNDTDQRHLIARAGVSGEMLPPMQFAQEHNITIPRLETRPMSVEVNGSMQRTRKLAVISNSAGRERIVGSVSERYNVVDYNWFLTELGETGFEVASMGVHRNGALLYTSTDLGNFDLRGEEHRLYATCFAFNTGLNAVKLIVSDIRAWCSNQLEAMWRKAESGLRVSHIGRTFERIREWLCNLKNGIVDGANMIREQLDHLIDIRINATQLERVWKKWGVNINDADAIDTPAYRGLYEIATTATTMWQEGSMTGYNQNCAGTAYGLYNALVEVVDHGKYSPKRTVSALSGTWQTRKEKFHAILQQVGAAA